MLTGKKMTEKIEGKSQYTRKKKKIKKKNKKDVQAYWL
jgi:hypothetical protein